MKQFNTAPLPFMGQKRRFLKELKPILLDYPDDAIYIDLFGGSGLLSHFVKSQKPNAKVIYNDFDNYAQRLQNVELTNSILEKIRPLVANLPKDKKIPGGTRADILEIVHQAEQVGFVDYITLSSSLLFSMKYVTTFEQLKKESFYNVVKQTNYDASGYLEGVERVTSDYKSLFEAYKANSNVVFLVDPPYLSTETRTYTSDGYWKLGDYLDVLKVLVNHKYIYFTSNKSSIIELCEWIDSRTITANPFNGAVTKTVNVTMNYNSSYTDVMLYKTTNLHYKFTKN